MPIQDRILKEITLISPEEDGNKTYIAKWIGDPVTKEKKLGIFDTPKAKGTIVQDLEIKGNKHQLTLYFDGPDNDLLAQNFWSSLDAKGTWIVRHPLIAGVFEVYLMRAVWQVEPVRSMGFTTFNTNWIEPLPESFSVSVAEIEQNIKQYVDVANESAARQFDANADTTLFEDYNALVSAASKSVGAIQSNIRKFENLQIIDPRLIAIFDSIDSILGSFPLDTSALTAQFEDLYESIGLTQNSSIGAVDNWLKIAASFTDIATGDTGKSGRNEAAVLEENLSLVNAQLAASVTLPGAVTRGDAVELAEKIDDYFQGMIATLDNLQQNFNNVPIEDQYISQSLSFGDQLNANRQAILYLLRSSTDLKIERVFTTEVNRATIEIAWTELGGPGEIIEKDGIRIDKNYSDFCDWNDLHGKYLNVIPALTEVRVFV